MANDCLHLTTGRTALMEDMLRSKFFMESGGCVIVESHHHTPCRLHFCKIPLALEAEVYSQPVTAW